MLYTVLRYLRNFFVRERYSGFYTIANGTIQIPVTAQQYFLIEGSAYNDGVHRPDDNLNDETFEGCVSILAIPEDLLNIVQEIEAWCSANAETLASPYESESFGGYTYHRKKGSNGSFCWQDAFAARLNIWRRM